MRPTLEIDTAGPRKRGRRLHVRGDDGDVVWERTTSAAVVKAAGLSQGMPADVPVFEAAIDAGERSICSERAAALLAYRPRSVREMRDRLTEDGYPAAIVSEVVDRFVQMGYLDDAQYAEMYARSKMASGWGYRKIREGLGRKGVDEHVIERIGEEYFDDEGERERAREMIGRFDLTDPRDRDRALRRLVSKGFAPDIAFSVIRSSGHDG